jgi:RHS repeat-associated protein
VCCEKYETRITFRTLNTNHKFTDQREEAALGIYFFNARWFDPSLGRFISPDTIVPTGTQGTQAWDRYAFVNNNPVRYNDPTGHVADDNTNNCNDDETCNDGENQGDPPPSLEELCGSESKIGCSIDGNVMLLWLDGQYITIDVNSLTNEQMLIVTDFAFASSNYESSMNDLPWDIGAAALGTVGFVALAGEMVTTAPVDLVVWPKLGFEIAGLVVTGGIAAGGVVKTGIDAYKTLTIPSNQAANFEYLKSIAIMSYP